MHRRAPLIVTAGVAAAVACGHGDSSSSPADGGGADGTVPGVDAGGHDAATVDTGARDASDGGHDGAATTEAGPETGAEAGTDAGGTAVGASVLEYHNHHNRDGYFQDKAITAASTAKLALDPAFAATFPDNTWASPLYVENGVGGKGTFYVATAGNDLYAFDETTGAQAFPVKSFGSPATTSGAGCGDVQPIGITGTPAIDLATRLVVFDAVTGDGTAQNAIATHTIHAASIDDGSAKWSIDVSTLKDPTGLAFSPQAQNQRGAVLIVGGIAYVVFGGHGGDCGSYHGWVVGVPLSGTGAKAWATQVVRAGIWAVGGAASDGQSVFAVTGNGYSFQTTTWQGSEGMFRFDPGPTFTGQPADYFTPYDWLQLDNGDADLGGSGPLVIDAPALAPSALLMAQGKDGYLYLVQRSNLGGMTSAAHTANVGALQVSDGAIVNGSAWATVGGTTYVVMRVLNGIGCPNGTSGDLVAVKLDPAAPQKMSVVWCASNQGKGSPIITSSDGTHDGLVWSFGAEVSNQLHAWDLATGAPVFDGGGSANAVQGGHRFATILAAHGRVLVAADGGLHAFKGP
jgi:hypothetical protein